MNGRFLAVAKDPRIIPAVHHHCDEWCDYCPVSNRCLAFRCTAEFRKAHGRLDGDPTFASMNEAVAFTRDLAAIDGTSTEELDALMSHAPGESGIETSDPLASVAWEYAVRVTIALARPPLDIRNVTPRRSAPEPAEVVVWYHLRIYMRVFRALVAKERANGGSPDRMEDALGSAKLVLVSVQRSRAALKSLRNDANGREINEFVSLLDTLECGIDERFPTARSFVRIGLDVPVS